MLICTTLIFWFPGLINITGRLRGEYVWAVRQLVSHVAALQATHCTGTDRYWSNQPRPVDHHNTGRGTVASTTAMHRPSCSDLTNLLLVLLYYLAR